MSIMSSFVPIHGTQLSSFQLSHSLNNIPLNSPFLFLPSHRVVLAISHAVRARNINFVSSYEEEEEEFVRRRRGKGRKPSRGGEWGYGHKEVEGGEGGGVVDQLVDGLWILKVFKSYGLFIPVILISLLLATGPKAFLLGSGVPFGLSLLAFAFNKLLDFNPFPTRKPKSRPPFTKRWTTQQGERVKRKNYENRGASSFGGWDELVTEDDEAVRIKRPTVTEDRLKMMRQTKGKVLSSTEMSSTKERIIRL